MFDQALLRRGEVGAFLRSRFQPRSFEPREIVLHPFVEAEPLRVVCRLEAGQLVGACFARQRRPIVVRVERSGLDRVGVAVLACR